MTYSKGGRGKKAPYQTEIVRVPSPIRSIVDSMIAKFRAIVESGEDKAYEDSLDLLPSLLPDKIVTSNSNEDNKPVTSLSKEDAIKEAQKILRSKKAKKVQFEKLLQVIYNDSEITLE